MHTYIHMITYMCIYIYIYIIIERERVVYLQVCSPSLDLQKRGIGGGRSASALIPTRNAAG